jgi:hypothetical protein
VCAGTGQPNYVSVIDLGSAQGWSYATGINNHGVVVGMDGSRGFSWSPSGGRVPVPGSAVNTYAVAINDAGVMAAGIATWQWLPCRYDPAVDTEPVCQPREGRSAGINAAGTVTGYVTTDFFNNAPVTSMIRLDAGSLEILPPVPNPGNPLNAYGTWIDGDGTVVGVQATYGAIRYMAGRGTEALHDLLPSGSNQNFLYSASFIRSRDVQGVRSGEILGYAGWYDDNRQRGFRIKTNAAGDVTAIDKLPLPPPYPHDAPNISSADASNASGKIVGTVYNPSKTAYEAAFVYTDVVDAINLNDLIDPQSGWTLLSALGINDHDEVVGYGTHYGLGRAFKLTLPDLSPCPAPTACHLQGTRDVLTGICSNPVAPDLTACDDQDACKRDDVCMAGVCRGQTPVTCQAVDTCHDTGTCNSSSLPPPPSTQNLLGWWKLDGNGDDAVGDHNLTNEGPAVAEPGRSGMAMRFDGTSCLYTPIWDEARMQGGSGLTVMAWIKPDVYACDTQNDVNTVVGRGWDYSIGAWCYQGLPAGYGQGLNGEVRNVGAQGWGYGGGYGSGTGWHHVAITWDHQNVVTFLDGKGFSTVPYPGDITDWDPMFTIGCMTSSRWTGDERINNFHGAIDEVMLYDRPLSRDEVQSYWVSANPCASSQQPLADNTTCTDGDLCTQTDRCQAGKCVGSNPKVCTAQPCHEDGYCSPSSGTCVAGQAKVDGATCEDGNLCTRNDTCQAGVCTAGTTLTCTASDQCHTAGTCDPATGICANPSRDDDTSCDDGDPCTISDACQAGACRGTPKSCAPQDGCHIAGACNPATGACENPVVADGTPCEDGNLCTNGTTCKAGACSGGQLTYCAPQDQCHGEGVCNPRTGTCTNPLRGDTTPCDDGDPCTFGDICVQGTCQSGSPKTCLAADSCHLNGTCDPTSGVCSNPLKQDPSCAAWQPPPVKAASSAAPGTVPPEITALDPVTGTLTIMPEAGAAGSNPVSTTLVIPVLIGTHIDCAGDVDGNGTADVVFTDAAASSIRYLPRLDPEVAAYGAPIDIDVAIPAGEPGPTTCADIDGDGNVDIVTSFATPDEGENTIPTIVLYRLTALRTFQRIVIPHGFPAGVAVGGLSLADFDGDGRLDLAAYAANNQPLLDSQLFVFPNGGFQDLFTSGQFDQPFSQTTRVSVGSTDVLATPDRTNWGSLTTLDADADGHPDIWALGNRGIVLLYRSVGGFQFARPEMDGLVDNLDPKFTIAHLDVNRDGISDLLVSGSRPGDTPRIYPGSGGGAVLLPPSVPDPRGSTFTGLAPQKFFKVDRSPTQDPPVGLVKGSPVVTTYPDDWGVMHPSILLQSVDGHLVERAEIPVVTTTMGGMPNGPITVHVSRPMNAATHDCLLNAICNPDAGGTAITITSVRHETRQTTWVWVDHGLPSVPDGEGTHAHQTIVDSQPTVVFDSGGSTLKRRIFVRGLDGHLWQLLQDVDLHQWIDLGFPGYQPLVASPSAVSDIIDGKSVTRAFVLDAGGGLDYYTVDDQGQPGWTQAGLIGYETCFGNPGFLGEGSPKAISFYAASDGKRHQEVFVVGGMGDLLSWRDGVWEEIFDLQYQIKAEDILPQSISRQYLGCTLPSRLDHGCFATLPVCTNTPFKPTPPGPNFNDAESIYAPNGSTDTYEHFNSKPDSFRKLTAVGTPAAVAYYQGGTLKRSVFVRLNNDQIVEYTITGDAPVVRANAKTREPGDKTPVVSLGDLSGAQFRYVTFPEEPTEFSGYLLSPFCEYDGDGKSIPDKLVGDPVAVVDDLNGVISVLSTDFGNEHRVDRSPNRSLTIAHRLISQPQKWQFEHREFADPNEPFNSVLGTSGAIPLRSTVDPDPPGGALDILAVRSNGILVEANSRSNAASSDDSWGWHSCLPWNSGCPPGQDTCPTPACFGQSSCVEQGSFAWLLDNAHDHRPPGVPRILTNTAATRINNRGGTQSICHNDMPFDLFLPQWVSPQRVLDPTERDVAYDHAAGDSTQVGFEKGYRDEVMVQVEGVVVRSHVAAVDAPPDHTHGAAGDIPRVHHDWNIDIALESRHQYLLSDANMLAGGVMELEWEMPDHLVVQNGVKVLDSGDPLMDGFTRDALPGVGDHVAVRGRFIFDCGHPPYRTEIHPIDVIAVIHGGNSAKLRYSPFGGMTWYQPGDVNLPFPRDEAQRFKSLAGTLLSLPKGSNTGIGPLDDFTRYYGLIQNLVGDARFATGCGRTYDTELIAPDKALYFAYDHDMNDRFPGHVTMSTPDFPVTFSPEDKFKFTVPGNSTAQEVQLADAAFATKQVYPTPDMLPSATPPRNLRVCFERFVNTVHDSRHLDEFACDKCLGFCFPVCFGSPDVPSAFYSVQCQACLGIDVPACSITECCDEDTSEELVTWITAGDQAKIYEDSLPFPQPNKNCLDVKVYPGDTLRVGSHGFECDFSCGEHWDDPDGISVMDDHIGTTSGAFTEAQNFGVGGGPYVLSSQPDLSTPRSRQVTANDYSLHVTITENDQ